MLRFVVPLDPATTAPVETATYVAELTCSQACAGAGSATGSLLRSAATSTTAALLDLPLSTETIPGLAAIQGVGTLSISIIVTDAAGNSATSSGFNFLFHVIGPPLAMVEDRNYPSQEATNSIYGPYHLSDNSYTGMWTTTMQIFPGNQVRLLRYFITNPTDQPVALQVSYAQDPNGSWRMYEDWNAYELPDPRGLTTSGAVVLDSPWQSVAILIDGFTYYNTMYWAIPYGTVGTLAGAENGPLPCANPTTNWLMHRMGDTENRFVCKTAIGYPGLANANGAYSTGDVGTVLNQTVPALSGAEQQADMDSTGKWFLVPAATTDTPGTLVLYLTRPITAPRTRALQWNAYMAKAPVVNHYQTWDYVIWDAYQHGQTPYTLYPGYDSYVANRAGTYLTYATDQLFGSFTGTTHAYLAAALVGEPTARLNVPLERQSLTTH